MASGPPPAQHMQQQQQRFPPPHGMQGMGFHHQPPPFGAPPPFRGAPMPMYPPPALATPVAPPVVRTPNETLYIHRLNDRVNITKMRDAIRNVCSPYGNIVDIKVKRSLKMKGQAFVIFDDIESAKKAIAAIQGQVLFKKPMVVEFADFKSDQSVSAEELEEYKAKRAEEKAEKLLAKKQAAPPAFPVGAVPPGFMPYPPFPGFPPSAAAPAGPALSQEDTLPPNNILFVQNLPEDVLEAQLSSFFSRYTGFKEVRLVPSKKDIAFIEFDSEITSAVARAALNGHAINEKPMKVTFAKK